MIELLALHHVSIPVTNLERSRQFYGEVLGLEEIPRPPFDFPGAWYRVGSGQLHLIVHDQPTLRTRGVDSHDVHFAIRVRSYRGTLESLHARGYNSAAADELRRIREQPAGRAGFPQVFLLDPDRHMIELNAERID